MTPIVAHVEPLMEALLAPINLKHPLLMAAHSVGWPVVKGGSQNAARRLSSEA